MSLYFAFRSDREQTRSSYPLDRATSRSRCSGKGRLNAVNTYARLLLRHERRQIRMAGETHDRSPARVAQALRGRGGRSPLYVWMWENYAELSAARVQGRRADWISAAEEIRRMGIKSERGGKVNAETMRRTWANVDKNAKAFGWTGDRHPAQPGDTAPAPRAPVESTVRQTYRDIGAEIGAEVEDDAPKIVLKRVTRPE